MLDAGEQLGMGVRARIVRVHSVDGLGHQQHVGLDLQRALRRGGVGREVGHAHAGAEDHDATLLQVTFGAQRDVRLRDLAHVDGGLDTRGDTLLLEEVLEGEAVHHGAQHPHVIAAGAVEATLLQLGAAEEVPAPDHDRDLRPRAGHLGDLTGDRLDHIRVDTHAAAAEHLAAQLEHHSPVAVPRVGHRSPRPGRIEPVSRVNAPDGVSSAWRAAHGGTAFILPYRPCRHTAGRRARGHPGPQTPTDADGGARDSRVPPSCGTRE